MVSVPDRSSIFHLPPPHPSHLDPDLVDAIVLCCRALTRRPRLRRRTVVVSGVRSIDGPAGAPCCHHRLRGRRSVHDATAGYRAYRAEALGAIGLEDVASEGYCFQVDLTRRAVRAGLTVREVPITFTERETGRSKMSGSIVREALVRVTVWGIRDRLAGVLGAALPSRLSPPVPRRPKDDDEGR